MLLSLLQQSTVGRHLRCNNWKKGLSTNELCTVYYFLIKYRIMDCVYSHLILITRWILTASWTLLHIVISKILSSSSPLASNMFLNVFFLLNCLSWCLLPSYLSACRSLFHAVLSSPFSSRQTTNPAPYHRVSSVRFAFFVSLYSDRVTSFALVYILTDRQTNRRTDGHEIHNHI